MNDLSNKFLEFQLEDSPSQITALQDLEPMASNTDASLDMESIVSNNIFPDTSNMKTSLLAWWIG